MKLLGVTMFSRTMERTAGDFRFLRGRALCSFHTSPLLLRFKAGLSPSVGSNPPSASMPFMVLSTGSRLGAPPVEAGDVVLGATAEKAAAFPAKRAKVTRAV
eukprot:Lithocolla_globosa_v1_NODE_4875_length_1347_cov_23.923375.p4 type:complete len:102 gc:universal NODE_4875_length_1347_cov_23.923375:948-1253(+)